jgi:hypothetical protein
MSIITQHATAVADTGGQASFVFPDVPMGELWSGTTSIPLAPPSAVSTVTAGGLLVGAMYGPGSYGPWTVDHSSRLIISSAGLTPSTQYQAVWHADDKGATYSTYPAPITPTVSGSVAIPVPVPASQSGPWTMTVSNFPSTLAAVAPGGLVTMTGAAVTLPAHSATAGVVLAARSTNAAAITIDTGLEIDAGQMTPLLPVANSNVLSARGTSGDVLSFLVT